MVVIFNLDVDGGDDYTVAFVCSISCPHFSNTVARLVPGRISQSPSFIPRSLQLGSSEFASSRDRWR